MNDKTKCPECGNKMRRVDPKKPYKYTASGLDHVRLIGVEAYECDCGKGGMVWIPAIGQLHRAIAFEVLKKPASLNGQDLRFLRKHFRMKAVELSNILNVTKQTVSRWENEEEKIGLANDRLARIFFILLFIEELDKTRIFAEEGKRILNEKSLGEIRNIFDLSIEKKKRFSIDIDERKLRKTLDPFESVTA